MPVSGIRLINTNIITPNRLIRDGFIDLKAGKIKALGSMSECGAAAADATVAVDATTASALAAASAPAAAASVAASASTEIIDLKGCYAAPGFIEMHSHGGGGADVMDGTSQAILTFARAHAKAGVTGILASTLTSSETDLLQVLHAFKEAKKSNVDGAKLLGIHLEGPYLSPEMSGAQDPRYLKNPDPDKYLPLLENPDIKRGSVSPELPGAMELGRHLRERGILAAMAHTKASYDKVLEALDNGYSHITHFYSCTSTVTRERGFRIAGAVEAGYLDDDITIEIIADGKHLPPPLLKLIYKSKGSNRTALISDSMRAMGMPEGESILGGLRDGQKVIVEDGVAAYPDRSSLAGSVVGGNQLIRNMVNLADVPLLHAVRMMSKTPANILGISGHKGTLAPGMDADVTVLDKDLNVVLTIVEGRIVYDNRR
jgi:N-acetylglucosamine-6-phosphate deacetylase